MQLKIIFREKFNIFSMEGEIIPTAPAINTGDTAWVLTSTAFVLLMTLPGLALYYGGMTRARNVLSVFMHSFTITAVVSIIWVLFGYSLIMPGKTPFIGGLDYLLLLNLKPDAVFGTIPESVFLMFQLMFAIIASVIIIGAFVERTKFSAAIIFCSAWLIFAYLPIHYMLWNPYGFLYDLGALDFAGGNVVHINAGIAGLVACIMIGPRIDWNKVPIIPHNMPMVTIGSALLFMGWFGFNAGSALGANAQAGMAMLVTHTAAAVGGLTWMFIEIIVHKKPSLLGMLTGTVAGLVGITPASGTCGLFGAIVIGICASAASYYGVGRLKRRFKYDDSLDAFGVHGVGGIVGALLTGVFALESLGGTGIPNANMGIQLGVQLISIIITVFWSGLVSFIILLILKKTIGLRVPRNTELKGLDLDEFNECAYDR